jgi:mRNA interferase MazF
MNKEEFVKRGEIWTVSWTGLAGKPRPALVIQSEEYSNTDTDILALVTSDESMFTELRLELRASAENGLDHDSFVCLDKLMAIPFRNIGKKLGKVEQSFMYTVDKHLIKLLGIDELYSL